MIEWFLIAVFAGIGIFVLVLTAIVLLPRVGGFFAPGTVTPAAIPSLLPTPALTREDATVSPQAIQEKTAPSFTQTPFSVATSTSLPPPSPSPSVAFPQPTLTARPIGFSCDRPGWFPQHTGIREHTVFRYQDHTYVLAAQRPGQHAFLVARSTDLCHWEELAPILTKVHLDAWDGREVRSPFVFEQGGVYYLFYTGVTWPGTERILLAASTNPADAASWQVQGEAFRPNHPAETWQPGDEAICRSAMVVKDGDIYYLYYTGRDTGGGIVGAGVASAPTGPWEDWGAILPATAETDYESPFVVVANGQYYLFYHLTGQGTQYRIANGPLGPWSEPFDLAPGWAHEIWQEDGRWFTSFLTDYSVTLFPLVWKPVDGLLHPVIETPSPFLQDIPIWAHSGEPRSHEVVLFRRTFRLDQPLTQGEIDLFADTRYEAWLDGQWLGRGPARFSYRLREYDVYRFDQLAAGEHTLAVLVQWAPNTRRSESIAPFLQGHLRGQDAGGETVIVRTNAAWKASLSQAWQAGSALVHSWGLIGPTELLDLTRFAADWNQPGFDDGNWPAAAIINPSAVNYQPYQVLYLRDDMANNPLPETEETGEDAVLDPLSATSGVVYRPRSIPPLVNAPIPVTILDAGLLSPGFRMGELPPSVQTPYQLPFTVHEDTYFTLEAPGVVGPVVSILIDGETVGWKRADGARPDVYQARVRLFRGAHTLTFTRLSATGTTFSVSTENVSFKEFPFSQGQHAGRRMLLGATLSAFDAFDIVWEDQLGVDFPAAPSYLVLDLGRTVHGRIVVEAAGASGTVLDMGWDERLVPGTKRPLPFPGSAHKEWNQVDSWILDGRSRTVSTLDVRSGRYIMIAKWGDEPLSLRDIRVYEERYPLELRGSFESSDPLLDRIWQVGVETLYANMNDAYIDTSWRERGQWWGDAYVSEHVNRVSFGDTALLRRGLRYMADSYQVDHAPGLAPNSSTSNMTDYMMLWVQSLAGYVQLTGDKAILNESYPVLQKFMLQMAGYESARTGLIDFPQKHWWLFVYVDMYGWFNRYGQATAVNSIYYGTLLDAAYLAEQTGDLGAANQWREKAERIRSATNRLLFSPVQQRYLSTDYQGYSQGPTVHAQAWPLAYGVPVAENEAVVADALLALLSNDPQQPNMGIYGLYWVFDALGKTGRIEEALALIRTYYGYMLGRGATTWWERLDADQVWTQSLSHAWGGSPTWFLTTYVLGARQTGPDRWEVRPAFAGVTDVSGTLPLQRGVLQVSWKALACGQYQVDVAGEVGTLGQIILPQRAIETIALDGKVVWRDGAPVDQNLLVTPEGIHVVVGHGPHTVLVAGACPFDTP
ncbi:MAG: family 78 glycoside hydrolase catalytic domain [Chloroflexota bacterium]